MKLLRKVKSVLQCSGPNDYDGQLQLLSASAKVLLQAIEDTKTKFMENQDVTDDMTEEGAEQLHLPEAPTEQVIEDRKTAVELLHQHWRDLLVYRTWLKALTTQLKKERRKAEVKLMHDLKYRARRMITAVHSLLAIDKALDGDENPDEEAQRDAGEIPSHMNDSQTGYFLEKFYLYQVSCNQKIFYVVKNVNFEN